MRTAPLTALGRVEWMRIRSPSGMGKWSSPLEAKLDTGADWSRIGAEPAADLRLGPILKVHVITTSSGAKGNRVRDRKSTRLNSSHLVISYAVFCLKKKNKIAVGRHALLVLAC